MELNDLVKMLVKAENPRRQAIERATAIPAKQSVIVNGTQLELPFSFAPGTVRSWAYPAGDLGWTATTTDSANTTITTATNAVVFGGSSVA